MRFAVTAALIMTTGLTSVALAQDGTGHGPPKVSSVVFLAQPSAPSPTSSASKIFQPKSVLMPAK
jgi:hypothetical protein